ncbi:hypothetical protein DNTS_020909 [Danionella cerebrum]|uniref:CAP-Gly domain-containing protein n=1 Tax=Danionella cerebrum TaxID=2873325 RepID=A0A553PX18_9TELE|nr:hypothetical protein DNTS_020909 [Danionella translucida]
MRLGSRVDIHVSHKTLLTLITEFRESCKIFEMATFVLWSAVVWTLKGLLCTWRFFWVSPYCALKTGPRTHHQSEKLTTGVKTNAHTDSDTTDVQSERKTVLFKRLLRAEEEIHSMKMDIVNQRASWETRFVELQRKQQDLREQLTSEIMVRTGMLLRDNDSDEINDAVAELMLENGLYFEEKDDEFSGGLKKTPAQKAPVVELDVVQKSETSSQASAQSHSRSISGMSNISVRSWRSTGGLNRVFVPHSPLDLKIGHRVRIILPSGRISTGNLRFLGKMQHCPDYTLGVELETADNEHKDGTFEGNFYFDCEPGHGAFVAFSKLLMAWE